MADTVAEHPTLAALWDTPQNSEPASKVATRSYRAATWRCVQGHSFQRSPRAMQNDASCPTCNGDAKARAERANPQESQRRPSRRSVAKRSLPDPDTLAEKLGVEHADRIIVHDRWWGAPGERALSYTLTRDSDNGFQLVFRAMINGEEVANSKTEVAARAVNSLLRTMASAQLSPGAYTPRFEWTDDYPTIEIVVDARARVAFLFSRSQGELHTPWGACIDGELFTLPGDEIGRALRAVTRLVPQEDWFARQAGRIAVAKEVRRVDRS